MPRARKQCPKPDCRKAGPHEHTKAWRKSKNQVPISNEFRSLTRALRQTYRSFVCGVNLGTGGSTGDGCQESIGASEIEFDHIIPRSRGGTDTRRNLQGLCRPCHRKKTQRESRGEA